MLRTALLIALVIAGSPVGSLACELWCKSPANEEHHRAVGCHDASQSGPQNQQIAPYVAGCHHSAGITPFVIEARPTESRSIASAPVAAAPAAFFDACSIGPDRHETTTGWCAFNAERPRPSSSHLVLRV
jgi:hypothetical protein